MASGRLRMGLLALGVSVVGGLLVPSLLLSDKRSALPIAGGPPPACTVYEAQSAVRVTIMSPAGRTSCETWIAKSSSGSSSWSTRPGPGNTGTAGIVCDVKKASTEIFIFDVGRRDRGHTICGNLVGQGWHEQNART